jgi:3-hydroxy-9,10-secoandrosta-1,3,5(10)-triene-9,17-dione monooxygenase
VTVTAIAPPEPDLEAATLVERARALVPGLRERQEETERAGRILDVTCREFLAAGFYRILQPRRFGGYELDLPTFSRVAIELARGCPSSAWAYTLTAGHVHMLSSLWPEDAQADIYGPNEDARVPGTIRPLAEAVPVEGGFRITGAWDYVSGCDVATHFLLGGRVAPGENESPRTITFIADAEPFAIVDNWDVLGLRGTGSKRVVAEGVFLPEHRVLPGLFELDARTAPGRSVHANPFYAAGGIPALIFSEITAVSIGLARGALDLYEETLRSRNTTIYPIGSMHEHPGYHRFFGEVVQLVDVAEAALLQSDADYMELCRLDVEEGLEFGRLSELRLMLRKQYCCKLASDALQLMIRSAGSSTMKTGDTLQRYLRDMTVLTTHNTVQPELAAYKYGQLVLTVPPDEANRRWVQFTSA